MLQDEETTCLLLHLVSFGCYMKRICPIHELVRLGLFAVAVLVNPYSPLVKDQLEHGTFFSTTPEPSRPSILGRSMDAPG